MTDQRPFNALFLCTGNSARSVMAECIMNRLGMGKFKAYSAGSRPNNEVHPQALSLLRRLSYSINGLRSKSWDEFAMPDAPPLDFIFTVCDNAANEVCPIWPGQPMSVHWGIADPAAATGSDAEIGVAFSEAHRLLQDRISIFVNLPIESLDKISLQKRLKEIGKAKPEHG